MPTPAAAVSSSGSIVGKLAVHIGLNASAFVTGMNSVHKSLDHLSGKMASFGAKMSLAVTTPITLMGRKIINEFAEFDQAITRSLAVMEGATLDMKEELSDFALTLSSKVATSATDLAKGFFELGQAGLTASQSIEVLPIAEEFAYAGTMQLNTAVSYLTKSQRSLGLEMQDPIENMRQMQRVADNLTYAAIESTGEMIDFSEAMKNAGPALRILGKDIEEGTAALMALANQGHVGSEAGTQLYMVYRDLQRANITNRAVWEMLGLSVYDANREMRNIADIIEDLEKRFKGMADEEIRMTLMMLGFQDRSLRATQALFGLSGQMKRYEASLKSAGGTTRKTAEDMRTSFMAFLQNLHNKLFIVREDIGKIISSQFRKLTVWVDALVSVWRNLDPNVKRFIVYLAEIAALIGPITLLFSGLIKVLGVAVAAFSALISPLGLIALTFTILLARSKVFAEIFGQNLNSIKSIITAFSDKIKNWTDTDSRTLNRYLQNLGNQILAVKDKFVAFLEYFRNDWLGSNKLIWKAFLETIIFAMKSAYIIVSEQIKTIPEMIVTELVGPGPGLRAKAELEAWKKYRREYERETGKPLMLKGLFINADDLSSIKRFNPEIFNSDLYKKYFDETFEKMLAEKTSNWFQPLRTRLEKAAKEYSQNLSELIPSLATESESGRKLAESWNSADNRTLSAAADLYLRDFKMAYKPVFNVLKDWFETNKEMVINSNPEAVKKILMKGWQDLKGTSLWYMDQIKKGWEFKLLDFDFKQLEEIEGKAHDIVASLYSGMDESQTTYWDHQKQLLERDIQLWDKWAWLIAWKTNNTKEKIKELLALYSESQRKILQQQKFEFAGGILDSLYSGLTYRTLDYFNFADKRLKNQIALWKESAEIIKETFGIKIDEYEKLIKVYEEKQKELIEIQIKKFGNMTDQLRAAALQMKSDIEQTAGPWYEFATSMPNMLENGFMRILQAGRNWKDQMKAFLQEIAWEFVRIQAIKPIAMGLSQSFTGMLGNKSAPYGPSSVGTYTPPSFDYQVPGKLAEGGLATKPHLTWIAEKEPELVTPLSKLNTVFSKKEAPTIIVNNQTSTPISPSSIQWDPQRMVASVLLKDDRNRGPVSRSMKGRK